MWYEIGLDERRVVIAGVEFPFLPFSVAENDTAENPRDIQVTLV